MMTASDPDVAAAIDALKAERDRLQRILEFIAGYQPKDGYRAGFYALRWYARTALTGTISPGRRPSQKSTAGIQ